MTGKTRIGGYRNEQGGNQGQGHSNKGNNAGKSGGAGSPRKSWGILKLRDVRDGVLRPALVSIRIMQPPIRETSSRRPMPGASEIKWCFLVPLLMGGALVAMYFSGNRILETLVAAPYFDKVPWRARREFGLLEKLQNQLLITALVLEIKAGRRAP